MVKFSFLTAVNSFLTSWRFSTREKMARETKAEREMRDQLKADDVWGQFKQALIISEQIAQGDKSVELPEELKISRMAWYSKIHRVATSSQQTTPILAARLEEYIWKEFVPKLKERIQPVIHPEVNVADLFDSVALVSDRFLYTKVFVDKPFSYVYFYSQQRTGENSNTIFDKAFHDVVFTQVQPLLLQSIRQVTIRGNGTDIFGAALERACQFHVTWVGSDVDTYYWVPHPGLRQWAVPEDSLGKRAARKRVRSRTAQRQCRPRQRSHRLFVEC